MTGSYEGYYDHITMHASAGKPYIQFGGGETNFNAVFFLVNLEPIDIILALLCCRDNLVDFKL